MKRLLFALLVALLMVFPQVANPTFAAPQQQSNNCLFFTETGGGQGGFSVCDDAEANFRTTFNTYGLQRIGYPISTRYERDGFVTQAFQKAILQWRAESNSVAFVNTFDDLHNDGFDEQLLRVRQTPNQLPDGWDGEGLTFEQITEKRQDLLAERPALEDAYFSVSDPILFYGLPTSEVEDMGNHYAIRLQRAVLQEWKEDVPWASAGEVTVANGGDIAKELGGLPADALVPEAAPSTGATPAATAPAATATTGTTAPAATATTAPAATATTAPAATAVPTTPPTSGLTGKIVMTSNRTSFDDCYVANADGSNLVQITTSGQCYEAHFTPDGNAVVYYHDGDIYKVNADGTGTVNLTNTPEKLEDYPVVSPDGSKIAYLFAWEGGFEIYVMGIDGSNPRPVTSRNGDLTPTWSPDGSRIAFTSVRSGSFNIWSVNADGSDLKQVTFFGPDRIARSPVYSPNGSEIAFTTLTATTAWEIWGVGAGGGGERRIQGAIGNSSSNSAILAAWHGNQFLLGGYEGDWDPYFVNVNGGAPVEVQISDKDDKPSDWWVP